MLGFELDLNCVRVGSGGGNFCNLFHGVVEVLSWKFLSDLTQNCIAIDDLKFRVYFTANTAEN